MTDKHIVFVYGTLMDEGEEYTHYLESFTMFRVKGKTFDFPFIQHVGDYHSMVYGSVRLVDDLELAKLDKYENTDSGLFERIELTVTNIVTYKEVQAWAYVGGPMLVNEPIYSGKWKDVLPNKSRGD